MVRRSHLLKQTDFLSFKPKSQSPFIRKGKLNGDLFFKVANQDIPKISQESVKMAQLIPDRHPLWLARKLDPKYGASSFMLNSKLLWPLLVYKISISTVESIEAKINKTGWKKMAYKGCKMKA
ncbi:reverse transcriptase [Plakobranchus ocellatus]|uniref:Reverse transcriptase n=1 Tax=Plakobranchus ocellatus TaxID=259542 RepID=A0AAV3ZWI6_9GAST|nr:reverse transcriptase [Plakobranchus ocellatus]